MLLSISPMTNANARRWPAAPGHNGDIAVDEPRLNLPELTVSELSTALKRTIEDAYGYVRVRGELGKVSYHGNGHVYFDLKDDRASIAGVIWRKTAPPTKKQLQHSPQTRPPARRP